MKILFLNYMTTSAPAILRTLELARGTAEAGHKVVLAYVHPAFRPPPWVLEALEAARGPSLEIRHRVVPPPSDKPVKPAKPGMLSQARPTVLGLYRQSFGSLKLVPVERALMAEIRPDAVVARPDHAFSFLFSSKSLGIPLVLESDGPVEELDHHWGISSLWFRPMDTWRARTAGAVTHVSRVTGDLFRAKGIAASRLFEAANAADPEIFCPGSFAARKAERAALGIEPSDRVIGFSGNQRAWHGLRVLVEAVGPMAERNPGVRLLVVGAVEERAAIGLDLPENASIAERAIFTGPLPHRKMGPSMDAADILTLPYPDLPFFHFSPMKLFEGMALAKPIVGSDIGQVGEILRQIPSSRRTKPGNVEQLRGALIAALEDPEGAGADARDLLVRRHTWKHRGETMAQACLRAGAVV